MLQLHKFSALPVRGFCGHVAHFLHNGTLTMNFWAKWSCESFLRALHIQSATE